MTASGLEGKVALITGASGGMGSAIARKLVAEGAKAALHYFSNAEAADRLARELKEQGSDVFTVGGDATTVAGAESIVSAVVERFGHIDILVNNAGTLQNLTFGSITPENFTEQFNANTLSAVLMMQAASPHFPDAGGRIVNLSTNIVQSPLPGTAIYCAAKAAVSTLTLGFAKELGPRGITVNAVAPGATDTKMLAWLTDEMRQGIATATPLGRMAQPDDIADVVAFLASDASRWVSGRTLIVDGGLI